MAGPSAASTPFKIVPDPYAIRLKEWSDSEGAPAQAPRTTETRGGLVLVAEWGWAEDPENGGKQYLSLKKDIEDAMGECMYVYPPHATHVTVATLSNFKKSDAPRGFKNAPNDAVDARILQAWGDALESAFRNQTQIGDRSPQIQPSSEVARVGPFTLEAHHIELSPGAAFLHFFDPSGTIDRLRDLVKHARDKDPQLAAVVAELDESSVSQSDGDEGRGNSTLRDSVHIPDIVHSSFGRFIQDTADEAQVVARFSSIAAHFKSFPLRITRLILANECSPYMHQGREEGTIRIFDL